VQKPQQGMEPDSDGESDPDLPAPFPPRSLDDIVYLASSICDTPIAAVAFLDRQRIRFGAKMGLDIDELPSAQSFCAYTILQSEELIVHDPVSDSRFADTTLVRELGIRFYAGAPLLTARDVQPLGSLAVMDRVPHLPTVQQLDALRKLARLATVLLGLPQQAASIGVIDSASRFRPASPPLHKILLLESDGSVRNLLARSLEARGYLVFTASDGDQAFDICQRHTGSMSLVIGDVIQLDRNGVQLQERISAICPEAKFLLISSLVDQSDDSREFFGRSLHVLQKPFLPTDLLRKVEEILNQSEAATGTQG
jgi:CheY-like chemotaxis protein